MEELAVMSNKSSPPSRSSRTSPSARRRPRVTRAVDAARTDTAPDVPTTMKERLRHYLPFVGVPNMVLVLGIAVLCLSTILLSGSRPAALPAAIAETWFVLHGVPVTYDGVTLGAIPLLPAVGVAALIAWRVRAATKDRVSILDLYAIVGLVILIPFTLSAIAWFMVADASAVFPVAPPAVYKGLFIPVFIHLVGMAFGMSAKLWTALCRRVGVPTEFVGSTVATMNLALRLLAAATVVFLVLLAFGAPRIGELLDAYPTLGASGGAELILASVLYLPNAAVSTLAVLFGTPMSIAEGSVSLFGAVVPPLPPMPLFAAIPGHVAAWAPVFLIVPAAVIIHFFIRRRLGGFDVAVAAAWAAILALLSGLLAGGNVGAYGWIGPTPWIFALAAAAWVGGIAGVAWLVASFTRPEVEEKVEEEEMLDRELDDTPAPAEEENEEAETEEEPKEPEVEAEAQLEEEPEEESEEEPDAEPEEEPAAEPDEPADESESAEEGAQEERG